MKKFLYIIGILAVIGMIGSVVESCGGSKEKDRSLNEMLEENDFAAANKYLTDLNSRIQKGTFPHGDITDKYLPNAIQTLKAEASYLMDQDDPDAETLFMLCINDVAGNIGNYQATTGFFDGDNQTYTEFITDEVTPYNACLLSIIKEALIKDKPEFAKKVLKMMKLNYKCDQKMKEGTKGKYVYDYTYNYTEDNSQLEEAKKLIEDYEKEH